MKHLTIDHLRKAAEIAGEKLLAHFQEAIVVREKGSHQDLVTVADVESQNIIQRELLGTMKSLGFAEGETGFIGEESLHSVAEHVFIIDPLDGTTNFASGIEYFCISIAYAHREEIIAGVVYEPVRKQCFMAEKGKGVFADEYGSLRRLEVPHWTMNESIFVPHFASGHSAYQEQFELYARIYPHIRGLRSFGSITLDLCYYLEGTCNIVVDGRCFLWDLAAIALMIEEAGGLLMDWEGNRVVFDFHNPAQEYRIIACHPSQKEELLKLLGG